VSIYRKCVSIFLLKNYKIFVGQRIGIEGAWQLPQGGVEKNESLLRAAKRELFEETNVSTVEPLASSASYKYDFPLEILQNSLRRYGRLKYAGQKVTFFVFKFLGNDTEINVEKEPQEFTDWKWTSVEELLENIVLFKRNSYEMAVNEFQRLEAFPVYPVAYA
jgi:putative (di)nucleoside polyphosphate hydrolase